MLDTTHRFIEWKPGCQGTGGGRNEQLLIHVHQAAVKLYKSVVQYCTYREQCTCTLKIC